MSYQIIVYLDSSESVGHVLFDISANKLVSGGELTLTKSDIDNFRLTINQSNSMYNKIKPFKTRIEILEDSKLIFRGRALGPLRQMSSSGLFSQTINFESTSAYLLDSVQRFKQYHGASVETIFTDLINEHNNQVPGFKRFKVGKVDVTTNQVGDYIFIDYINTFDAIRNNLIDKYGGRLQIRYEIDGTYIDYQFDDGIVHETDSALRIGTNIKSVSAEINPSEVVTRLVPLGAMPESTNELDDVTESIRPRLDISTVNGGLDYIDIDDLQTEFGVINGAVVWDEITDPKLLLDKANRWIEEQGAVTESWSISAIDLARDNLKSFRVGDYYYFVGHQFGPAQLLEITEKIVDILRPELSTLEIGVKKKRLSSYQNDVSELLRITNRIKSTNANVEVLGSASAKYQSQNNKTIKQLTDRIQELEKAAGITPTADKEE